ncbi:drug resistance transporter, EmrB/QacA subfamily [Paenibacillus sophorae]|uniref:Drug resistance transporter, EmrB/QacA subfamily n=1 Tax=Paenibacillus sophorae TaxID=1333845 RepID=A0A1H8T7V7_9BACL|nr:MFS transporter [Paenibacillus sophorae]QWU17123.1 MFS transporter [Paenibacillus sophorae]SEO86654.1 drug resistance transporter, EmrB/QacA subfamily [Paenibacillus sophorae]
MNEKMKRVFAFTAIVLGFFMALLDTTIVNIALPEMTKHFGGSVSGISWVMNGYNLAFAVFILTASRLADQFGRRKVFLIGIALFTVSSLLAGFAPSLGALIVLRIIQGLAGAIIVPVTIPLTTSTFPKEMHGAIIGIWGAVSGLAAASGPALGGVLMEKLNWQWIFFVNVPLGVLSVILTLMFIGESKDASAGRRVDFAGTLFITGSMFCLVYGLIRVEDWGWTSSAILLLFAAGLLFLLLFLHAERKGAEPMLPLELMKIKAFNGAALTLLIVGAGLMNISLLTSFFLTRIMGMTDLKAGLILSMMAVGATLTSAISGPLSGKYGSRWFAVAGIIVMAGATYSLGGLSSSSPVSGILLRLASAGIGVGLTMAPVMSSAVRNVPEEKIGISSGVINMTKALGSVLGVAIIVTALQQNLDDKIVAARSSAVQMIRDDGQLLPPVKEALTASLQSPGSGGAGGTASLPSPESVAAAVGSPLRAAASKLAPAQRGALEHSAPAQMRETEVIVGQISGEMKEAAVKGFSRTFALAGLLLLPGVAFALISDRSPRRSGRDIPAAEKGTIL